MGRCRIIYRSDGRRITTGIIVLPRRCRLLRGYLRRRLYLLQKIPMRIIEHRILPLLRCRFLVLLPPTASRMRRTNGMRGEMRRSWGRMLWELLPPGTTSLDSLVCTVITALTVGGSSTMSFMEGIRLAISSSTQVSPICQSASKTLPFRSNPRQRCRRSSPPSSKNRRPSRRSLLQVRPYSLPMAARTFFPGPIRKPLDDSTRIIER